jgi:uncharacterized protein
MQAGNMHYRSAADIPGEIAVFPLAAALLWPGTTMPLNIFEPRYLEMIDSVIGSSRLIGIIQPSLDGAIRADGEPQLCQVGCLGRLTSFGETGDGRYLITLQGICRFRIARELAAKAAFRRCRISPFLMDLEDDGSGTEIDRPLLLRVLRAYLRANDLEADWDGISRTDSATLVNTLSVMAPYGPAEKQALLESTDVKARADTLVAITEMTLARTGSDLGPGLQ